MARFIQLKAFETDGERRTADMLVTQLPDEWVVIYGAMLIGFAGVNNEIDFFVVGEHGVYLIDDKSFEGKLVAGRGNWEAEFGPVENPVDKVEMLAKKAAGQIREGVPGVSVALDKTFFLHAYVSLSGQVDLQKTDRDATARVVLADRLPPVLLGFDRLPEKRALPIADYREVIVDYLTAGRQGVDPSETGSESHHVTAPESAAAAAAAALPPSDALARRRGRAVLGWVPVACLLVLALLFAFAYKASQPVRWDTASSHVGKIVTAYGPVVQSRKKPKWGGLSYINVGRDFRPGSATPFYLRIDPDYRAAIEAELKQLTGSSPSPWDAFGTKTIWVKGQVREDHFGGAYMLVTSAKEIHVGEPAAQSSYLMAALASAGLAGAWTLVLMLRSTRRAERSATNGGKVT